MDLHLISCFLWVLLLWCWMRGGSCGGLHSADQLWRDRRGFGASAVLVYLYKDGLSKDWCVLTLECIVVGTARWSCVRWGVLGARLLLEACALGCPLSWDSVAEVAEVAPGLRVSAYEPPVLLVFLIVPVLLWF